MVAALDDNEILLAVRVKVIPEVMGWSVSRLGRFGDEGSVTHLLIAKDVGAHSIASKLCGGVGQVTGSVEEWPQDGRHPCRRCMASFLRMAKRLITKDGVPA